MQTTTNARHLAGSDNALARIFSKHDDATHSGFITRLDRTPVSRKRLFFARSLIYNLAILLGSATLIIVVILRGYAPNVPESLRLTLSITQGMLLLWTTAVLVFSTSIPFFFGECRMRWKYGFRSTEVIVRRSPPESCQKTSQDSANAQGHWRVSSRAINPTLLYSNPTSMLSGDFWVMEYSMILNIYASMAKGELNEEDLEFTAWKECGGVWSGLELWRLQSIMSDQQEVALFKAFLMGKGKHGLLSTWESLFDNTKKAAAPTFEKYQSMVKRFSQEADKGPHKGSQPKLIPRTFSDLAELASTASPSVPLSDALIDIDRGGTDSSKGSSSPSPPRREPDELYPCIFHLYFGNCENVDCGFSHSSDCLGSLPTSRSTSPLNGEAVRVPAEAVVPPQCHLRPLLGFSEGLSAPPSSVMVVPEVVEVRVTPNDEVYDDPKDDNKSPTKVVLNLPDSYTPLPVRQASPAIEATPARSNTSDREAAIVHLRHNGPSPSQPEHADERDGADLEYTDSLGVPQGISPEPLVHESLAEEGDYNDQPDTVENTSSVPPAEGEKAGGNDDDDDKWGWYEDPQKKKGEERRDQTQGVWSFEGSTSRREEVDFEVEELEYAPRKPDPEVEDEELEYASLKPGSEVGDLEYASHEPAPEVEDLEYTPHEPIPGAEDLEYAPHEPTYSEARELDHSALQPDPEVKEASPRKPNRQIDEGGSVSRKSEPKVVERQLDPAWGQAPDDESHIRESWEDDSDRDPDPAGYKPHDIQDEAFDQDGWENDDRGEGVPAHDVPEAISEVTEEPDAGDEDLYDQYPSPGPEYKLSPVDVNRDASATRQTPLSRPASFAPSIQTRSPTKSMVSMRAPPSHISAPVAPSSVHSPTRSRSIHTPILSPSAYAPSPVPAATPPSLPPPIPASDARQTSMMSLHWCRFADPTVDPNTAFCKAFAQNKCSNTDSNSCTFRHCLTPQEFTFLFKDPQPLQFTLPKNLIRNDSPANANLVTSPAFTLHWSHFADPSADPGIAFCKSYAEHNCLFDTACNFRHCLTLEEYNLLFKDPQPNLIALSGTAQGQPKAPNQLPGTHRRTPCSFFAKGTCRNGANCPYSHECPNVLAVGSCNNDNCAVCQNAPGASSGQSQPQSQRPCTFWPQGKCRDGDKCQFAHIGEPGGTYTSGGGDDPNQGGSWGGAAENYQADAWASNGDVNAWDSGNGGNWDDGGANDNNNEEAEAQEVDNNQNQGTGWGDQVDTSHGWDDQANASRGWGEPNDKASSKRGQNNDDGWRGNPKGENSGWGDNKTVGDDGWGNTGNVGRGKQRDDDNWRLRKNDNKSSDTRADNGWLSRKDDKTGRKNQSNDNDTSGGRNDNQDWQTQDNRDDGRFNNRRGSNSNDWYGGGSRRTGVCRFFKQEGRCRRGSDCRFSHDLEQGGSSGHGSRDMSRPRQPRNDVTPPSIDPPVEDAVPSASAPRAPSTYGGRHHYDRGFIDEWKREVAASEAGSEAGGSKAAGRRGSGSHSGTRGRGRTNDSNRSVEHPTSDPCQFYVVGRCTIGDTCPSSHDPVIPGIGGNEEVGKQVFSVGESRWLGEDEETTREIYEGAPGDKVEEITGNDGINDNHIVGSKWGRNERWDDEPPRMPEHELQVNEYCLFWGQGFCKAGDLCRFRHVHPEQPSPEKSAKDEQENDQGGDEGASEPGTRDNISDVNPQSEVRERDYGHPFIEESIFGCSVVVGRDCLPDRVITGTDSHTVIFEGRPDIKEARVHDHLHKYGPIKDIIITRERPLAEGATQDLDQADDEEGNALQISIIRVEFKDLRDAAVAARNLKELNAKLADAIPIEMAATTSTWVRFRWPQATRSAWIYYSSITKAKTMAEKLHGTLFQGRKIASSFLRPDKRQKDLYAIKLERLPVDTTRVDLTEISQDCKLITVSELTYTESPREALQQSTGVKAFVSIPENPTKVNAVAFAHLDSESSMFQVLQMHGTKPKFLGKQELVVERVWFAHYGLSTDAFKSVSTEVAALQIKYEGRAQVESCDFGDHSMIYLHAAHEESDVFVQANLALQAICQGLVVRAPDGRPEWDEYFYSTSSTKVVDNLNAKNNFYIFPDPSARSIHVLGSGIEQDKGISMVKKLLQKLRSSCQEYPIHRNVLRQLIDGGLTEIQGDAGSNKVSLDVLRSVLVVRGGDTVFLQKIRHLLESSPSIKHDDESNRSRTLCSVCELQSGGGESSLTVKLFCGHVYCGTCLKDALMLAAQNCSAPVKCIGRVPNNNSEARICGQSIAYTTVRDLLPLRFEPEYRKAAFLSFIRSNLDEYFFCPSLRCDAVYRYEEPGSTIRCPICRAWLCLSCGSMTHDGVECGKAKEIRGSIRS
ncbi:hypothetical protein NP233_g6695 [Leucocoprinus birnbaumii]|uniref:Uncharacterized protein n=1 Tax=Leucocoprinus birnbaumii TaxID=56174 RepID=A0AAD5VQJ6_9AGAR|nr:hypothetical protein NP233_g6695 [Leucocoprinus birnbaumii]